MLEQKEKWRQWQAAPGPASISCFNVAPLAAHSVSSALFQLLLAQASSRCDWLNGPSESPTDFTHNAFVVAFTSEVDGGTQMIVFDWKPQKCVSSCWWKCEDAGGRFADRRGKVWKKEAQQGI